MRSFFNYAKTLSPAALDMELRSMVTLDHHSLFINALIRRLHSHRDFEAVQAMQNVFLKVHSDILIVNAEIREDLERLAEVHQKESQRVLELLASSLGTLGFVRSSVLQ
jgi:U3 small nucleolar RNA-associated protein 21